MLSYRYITISFVCMHVQSELVFQFRHLVLESCCIYDIRAEIEGTRRLSEATVSNYFIIAKRPGK